MNLLEKYYLQGKGKLMAGIFVLVVLLIISTLSLIHISEPTRRS